jgi:hypothetical protein
MPGIALSRKERCSMTRFTRAARWWFALGVLLGTAFPCGTASAGDHFHRKGQLVAVPVTTVAAPAQAVSVPTYSVPVVQAVPMQFSYIQTTQAGAVYLSAPTQGAAVTTAQAPVINIKLEAPSAPATTAPVPQSATPTAQAAAVTCPAPSVAAAPQVAYAVLASPTYAVSNVLVSQQAVPMQPNGVSKTRTGLFKHLSFFKNK